MDRDWAERRRVRSFYLVGKLERHCSCEHAVQEPARRLLLILSCSSFFFCGFGHARKSQTRSPSRLSTRKVIAHERMARLIAPPFHRDALRPFGMRHHMQHMHASETAPAVRPAPRPWLRPAPGARTDGWGGWRRRCCPGCTSARPAKAGTQFMATGFPLARGCAATDAAPTAITANSGICVSCGTNRVTRRRPKRAPSRSIDAPARPHDRAWRGRSAPARSVR